jgi:hypothetical protein
VNDLGQAIKEAIADGSEKLAAVEQFLREFT